MIPLLPIIRRRKAPRRPSKRCGPTTIPVKDTSAHTVCRCSAANQVHGEIQRIDQALAALGSVTTTIGTVSDLLLDLDYAVSRSQLDGGGSVFHEFSVHVYSSTRRRGFHN